MGLLHSYHLNHSTVLLYIFSQTANKRNKLTFIAEPLDDGLAEKLEAGKVNLDWDNRKVSCITWFLMQPYNYSYTITLTKIILSHIRFFLVGKVFPNKI